MPTTTTTTDPFTTVYRRLWAVLTGYADWAALAKAAGRVRFDEVTHPPNLDLAAGYDNAPSVVLSQGPFPLRPFHFDTGSIDMTLSHPLVIVGADLNVADKVNPLKWQTCRALIDAGPYLGMNRLVRGTQVRDAADHVGDPTAWGKDHRRVVSLLTIDVNVTVTKAEALAGTYSVHQT